MYTTQWKGYIDGILQWRGVTRRQQICDGLQTWTVWGRSYKKWMVASGWLGGREGREVYPYLYTLCIYWICSWVTDITIIWPVKGAFQVALVVKNPPANAGELRDMGSTPESWRSPEGGQGNPLQCSCLENPMDRGAWWATVHGVAKSQTQLKQLSTTAQARRESYGEGNGSPLQRSCLENPREGSLVGCRLWGHTESDTTDVI